MTYICSYSAQDTHFCTETAGKICNVVGRGMQITTFSPWAGKNSMKIDGIPQPLLNRHRHNCSVIKRDWVLFLFF